jgi:hypothetical protein
MGGDKELNSFRKIYLYPPLVEAAVVTMSQNATDAKVGSKSSLSSGLGRLSVVCQFGVQFVCENTTWTEM